MAYKRKMRREGSVFDFNDLGGTSKSFKDFEEELERLRKKIRKL